jgi:signal transduction histidine kinase
LQLRALFAQHAVLADAEKGLLVVEKAPLDVAALAHALSESCAYQPSGAGRNLVVRFPSSSPPVTTDFNLVLRILTNMVTNALEAAPSGTTVQVGYQGGEGEVVFSVHNQGAIPEDVAERIFQRSFSTKTESGHGLGTYSMRLLAENYLGGRVNFTSSPAEGTTFRLHLPT